MTEANTTLPIPTLNANSRPAGGLARWLASERVFRLIPFLLVEGLFVLTILVPFALTIWISLLKWRANRPFETARFAGFENYEAVLTTDQFWLALARTFYFAGAAVALELSIGFVLAMLVSKCTQSRRLYTTIFLVPMMIVPIVVGYNFSMIYIDSGPLNQILAPFMEAFGIDPRIRWLSHPIAAQWAIIIADIWQWTSLTFLIFLSGFAALPRHLVNAARVMGASPWQTFRHVELPLLKPVIVIALVIRTMEALKIFDMPMLLTQGGPGNATETISIYLWRNAWIFNKISYAAASSLILLVLFTALIYLSIWLLRRERRQLEAETAR